MPVPVIQEMAAALADPHFGPCRAEGFAAICSVVPTHQSALEPVLREHLLGLEQRIRAAGNRERKLQRHGYSRLLDLERLLFLILLLITYPDLAGSDPSTVAELESLVSPLPEGDLADRAAAFLARLHGDCYSDVHAIRADLDWLEANGFCSPNPVVTPIQLAAKPPDIGSLNGGVPPMGDAPVFLRVMTLLRHLLQAPFDRQRQSGISLQQHLIGATSAIPGGYLPGESATLRKDVEKILTPYGFRPRHDNVRHGYCLGTAVLSAPRLREVHEIVGQAAGRLADPSAQDLLAELDARLGWAGLNREDATPVRSYARHVVTDSALVRPDSLAAPMRAEAIERAIATRRRVLLRRFPWAGSHAESPSGELRVWPLQLIFHNVGWYLLFEEDHLGREEGLIRSERLDRLSLVPAEGELRRSDGAHTAALLRLERLQHCSGGIYFGEELEQQLAISSQSPQRRARALGTLRFSCAAWAFAFLREGLQRYPIEHCRFSMPLPGETWWHHPRAPHVLEPNPGGDSHPYPIELDLPLWTLERDVDLRTWLFAFGAGIRIEQPEAMRQELITRCRDSLAVHGVEAAATSLDVSPDSIPESRERQLSPESTHDLAVRRFPNRWRRES